MPGKRARRERERSRARKLAERHAAGRWETLFETADLGEMRTFRERERELLAGYRDEDLRYDVLCARLQKETWYRLSAFVPDSATE
jgi:hypothetical protein